MAERVAPKNGNAGGTTTSSTKGMQALTAKNQIVPDVSALNATETFANPANLMCDEPYAADVAERQFGYKFDLLSNPENQEDTQGNAGWKMDAMPVGISQDMPVPGSSDPTPGGGW